MPRLGAGHVAFVEELIGALGCLVHRVVTISLHDEQGGRQRSRSEITSPSALVRNDSNSHALSLEVARRPDFQGKEANMLTGAILIAIVILIAFILWAISKHRR
jgi:hypothetical protein